MYFFLLCKNFTFCLLQLPNDESLHFQYTLLTEMESDTSPESILALILNGFKM